MELLGWCSNPVAAVARGFNRLPNKLPPPPHLVVCASRQGLKQQGVSDMVGPGCNCGLRLDGACALSSMADVV
jgi:hypothetical protein